MAAREKDQSDFDLEAFADLFDTAMTSDNPAVKKAFKNLMMIAAIVNAENKNEAIVKGPMRRLVEDQKNIIRRLSDLEGQKMYPGGGYVAPVPMPTYPTPTWVGPGTSPLQGGQWIPPNVNITSTTAVDDQWAPDPTVKYTLNPEQVRALSGLADNTLKILKKDE